MAEVDTSLTANAGGGGIEKLGKLAGTINAINENKLFMGREAAGIALQQSIDPSTGQIDFAQANALIASNPKIAPYAQQAMSEMLAQSGKQTENVSNRQKLDAVYADAMSADIAAAYAATRDPNAAMSAVARGVAAGRYPQEKAAAFLGGALLGGKDFAGSLADLAKIGAVQGGNAGVADAMFGEPGTVETGRQNVGVNVNRVTGERDLLKGDAAVIDRALSPESMSELVEVVDPATGARRKVPKSTIVSPTGAPLPGAAGGVQTSLAAGASEARSVAGQQNAQQALALQTRAAKANDNLALLGNMDSLLDEFSPGPQSGFWKGFGQLAAQYGIAVPGAPPKDQVAAQEEFGKLAYQLAQSQFQALGGTGTDSKLDSAMHTSPSELLSRYGNQGIISLLKGNEKAIQAQNDAWQRWQQAGNGPETYGSFLSQWGKLYDPRVFQAAYMKPADRTRMLSDMTKSERQAYEKSLKVALQLGWIK